MTSMQDILNTPSSAVEAPKPLPIGTYLCIFDGTPEFAKIGKNQTDCVNFKVKPVQAQEDVDQATLQANLTKADGSIKSLSDIKITIRQFLTEDALWRMKKMLDDAGAGTENMSIGQRIAETPGKQILVSVGHRPSDDGTTLFLDVKGTAKV